MDAETFDFSLSIGGAAGQGIATPGTILARIFTRRGLHLYAYNAYQSIVRGGHIFLTVRIADGPIPQPRQPPRSAGVPQPGHDGPPPWA